MYALSISSDLQKFYVETGSAVTEEVCFCCRLKRWWLCAFLNTSAKQANHVQEDSALLHLRMRALP